MMRDVDALRDDQWERLKDLRLVAGPVNAGRAVTIGALLTRCYGWLALVVAGEGSEGSVGAADGMLPKV